MEAGAFTDANYRGMGITRFAEYEIIKFCVINKLQLTTSCNEDNLVSAAAVRKFNFQQNFQYNVIKI